MKNLRDQLLVSERAVFGQLIVSISRLWRKAADRSLDRCGLSNATAQPLIALWLLGGEARQGAVAEQAGLEGPSVVRTLDLLVSEGLVTRREDPSDRRAKIIALTASGNERVTQSWDILSILRSNLISDVDEDELKTTVSVLRRLEAKLTADLAGDDQAAP